MNRKRTLAVVTACLVASGFKGNGHMMMLEKNNQEIAALIGGWLKDIK